MAHELDYWWIFLLMDSITSMIQNQNYDMWLFAYESTLFEVKYRYVFRYGGYIKGYNRRFYRLNTDLRGTPEEPGRTLTIVKSTNPEDKVYGAAFDLDLNSLNEALNTYNNNNAYTRITEIFYPTNLEDQAFKVCTNIYLESSALFKASSPNEIARSIAIASGTDGTNVEYLQKSYNVIKSLSNEALDDHFIEIKQKVDKIIIRTRAESYDPGAVVYKSLRNKAEITQYMFNFAKHIRSGNIAPDVKNTSLFVTENSKLSYSFTNFSKDSEKLNTVEAKPRILQKFFKVTVNNMFSKCKRKEKKKHTNIDSQETEPTGTDSAVQIVVNKSTTFGKNVVSNNSPSESEQDIQMSRSVYLKNTLNRFFSASEHKMKNFKNFKNNTD